MAVVLRSSFGLLLLGLFLQARDADAAITDFSTWTLIQDPADPNFVGASTATDANLSAIGGPISRGTDIGFASIDAATVAGSTSGYFFRPESDFQIAVDYSLAFSNSPVGSLGLGFGIGEDASGANSAGVSFLTQDGAPILTFGGAARVGDVNQTPKLLALAPELSGSLFIGYEAATGDITVGAASSAGASSPTVTGTFEGLQNQWNDADLLASFFIRSDGLVPGSQWNGGNADAVFSNFRVIQGTATAIPEPAAVCFLTATLSLLIAWRRRKRLVPA